MSQQLRGGTRAFHGGRRFGMLLVLGGALVALVWLWWNAIGRADTSFLPVRWPADWIVYPTPPQGTTHPRVELSTAFRREFSLDAVPTEASMQVAGFHRYAVSLNDIALEAPANPGANWKQPVPFSVSRCLRVGRNKIVVTVFNSNGPPSLWLALQAGRQRIISNEEWEASYAGASWRPARMANGPMMITAGSELAGGYSTWESLRRCWPIMLLLAAVSVGAWWIVQAKGHLLKIGRLTGEAALFAGLGIIWAALFANNLTILPPWDGFDSVAHMEYIRYITEHNSLPLANEGYEMFQPPLYYLLCAAVLKLCHLSLPSWGAVVALRVFGMGVGLGHFFLVWGSLRLLFPEERGIARWGGVLAACLPVMIYLSQYVTNEAFAAASVSGCIFVCLWMIQRDKLSWKHFTALGFCLGLAMLAKSTALLVLPPAAGALFWRGLQTGTDEPQYRPRGVRLVAGIALALTVCVAVSGWHYWRTWKHFGSPFVGVWDPRLGYSYWQDEGYRTASFFLRFGATLSHPLFSGLNSFADGIYSTLWGDGLMGGTSALMYHPPWNYDLMNVGYWLALLPTLAAAIGAWLAIKQFVAKPRPEWFLVLGLGFLAVLALVHMSIVVPQWCMIKAFYALCALVPFCACAAWGMARLLSWSGKLRPLLLCWFGLWVLMTLGAFWIPYQSVGAVLAEAKTLRGKNRFGQAASVLATKLKETPQNDELRSLLVDTLMRAGALEAAMQEAKTLLAAAPGDGRAHAALGAILLERKQTAAALQEYLRAVALAPGLAQGWEQLAKLSLDSGRIVEAAQAAQDGLAADPYSAVLHYFLGVAWNGEGQTEAAVPQLLFATQLAPKLAAPRVSLGAIYLAQGRLADAAEQYATAVQLDPNDATLETQLGKLLTMQGRLQEAANHLTSALRLQPTDAIAHYQLAVALEKQDDASGAILHYSEALRLQPGLAEASESLAALKQRIGGTRSQ